MSQLNQRNSSFKKLHNMKTIKVDRKKWLRGGKTPDGLKTKKTLLCDSNDNCCCLGFASLQLSSLTHDHLRYKFEPDDLNTKIDHLTQYASCSFISRLVDDFNYDAWDNTYFSCTCMKINDNAEITEEERERLLTKAFAEEGLRLEFYN
jgi:hypothetical protein